MRTESARPNSVVRRTAAADSLAHPSAKAGRCNADGDTDLADRATLLANFGVTCE